MDNIERRIAGLERSNRAYRYALSLAVLGCAAVLLAGFWKAPGGPLTASEIRVVDSKGRTVIEMRPVGDGAGRITVLSTSTSAGLRIDTPESRTCRANMQTIANALQAYRVRTRLRWEEIVEKGLTADTTPDLQTMPICPLNGTYSLEKGQRYWRIRCSLPDHGTFEPGLETY